MNKTSDKKPFGLKLAGTAERGLPRLLDYRDMQAILGTPSYGATVKLICKIEALRNAKVALGGSTRFREDRVRAWFDGLGKQEVAS